MEVPNDRDICLAFVPHFTSCQQLSGRLSSARHVQPVIDGQIRNDSAVHLSQSTSAFRQFCANDPTTRTTYSRCLYSHQSHNDSLLSPADLRRLIDKFLSRRTAVRLH
ncbi:hypothetical protein Zmor_002209 [Zophobas morio]|uniref:Uncharacterized protein n=1 Tax=Zophobas morio TaxID=2755281 RepID=A0AA38J077_9CUCU|nr:hypothetical protein Zmor_002209 [Zophobas morio]